MLHAHFARQAVQQRLPARTQRRVALPAGGLGLAGRQQRIESRLRIGRERGRQHHVGRCHAVEHRPAHGLRKLAQVLQHRARAVGSPDGVEARHAQALAHGVDVLHRDAGGVLAQVAVRQRLQRGPAALQLGTLQGGVDLLAQRPRRRVGRALQRRAAAGAALVHQHDVAPVRQPCQQPAGAAGQIDRTLPRPAREQEHRVGLLVARHGRQHREVHVDLPTGRLCRVQRALHAAAPGGVFDTGQAARGQAVGRGGQRGRQAGQQQQGDPSHGRDSGVRPGRGCTRVREWPPAWCGRAGQRMNGAGQALGVSPAAGAVRRWRSARPGRRRRRPACRARTRSGRSASHSTSSAHCGAATG